MLKRFLCWIGWHNWDTFETARYCDWCGRKQGLYATNLEETGGNPRFRITNMEWRDE